MTTLKRFIAWIAGQIERLSAWQMARTIAWEDRYIMQYRKQIDDALQGIVEAKERRARAGRRK